jgi:class 3 adenylate cyclase
LWRFIKNLSDDQLNYRVESDPELQMMDHLVRVYFHSSPLDDLTCIFIPISDDKLIKQYLEWIQGYFYDVNYPTSLLWLYALDSSLASLFPDEIIYLGTRLDDGDNKNILIPNFDCEEAVLLKRYSSDQQHYVKLEGSNANSEFRQIFTFLKREYRDRCVSRSVKQNKSEVANSYNREWEKFENVLKFGVSDQNESGCISFSDLRASTEFLNTFGKEVYLNKVQQPFFERTQIISGQFDGRIDKFMGDNVMCVFLKNNMKGATSAEKELDALLNNFFALFSLCKVLLELVIQDEHFESSKLGLRSGVTYGDQILRSNLGNEIVRDFTVTGETVNLAARLEHISMPELIVHNQLYFEKAINRFPQIRELISIGQNYQNLNHETEIIIQDFTLYQNILSNLEKLDKVKFDIRFNDDFYAKLRAHLKRKKYQSLIDPEKSEIYGYEAYDIEGYEFKFYFSYYNPKGFREYKRIWILPIEEKTLTELDITKLR